MPPNITPQTGTVAAPPAVNVSYHGEGLSQYIDAVRAKGSVDTTQLAQDLEYLADVIGPRLTGSPNLEQANSWALAKLRSYGADSAWLEPWHLPRAWNRGTTTIHLVRPYATQIQGAAWGWSGSTIGPQAGDVVLMDARTVAEFQSRFAGKIASKWVMVRHLAHRANPDGPKLTPTDSTRFSAQSDTAFGPPTNPAEREFQERRAALLAREKILGTIDDGYRDYELLYMDGSPASSTPYPMLVVPHSTYMQFGRLLARRERVTIEASVQNTVVDTGATIFNVVGELRGRTRPDEVVLLGAHLDSWDLGTGASDNGAGVVAILHALKLLSRQVRPTRTVRVVFFTGEEQGELGSEAYAKAHQLELGRMQAVLVLDNGTGRITGISLQGRSELDALWSRMFAAIPDLGPFVVRNRNKGATDHVSFLPYGVPAFNFDQERRGYRNTHHSEADTFDNVVLPDVTQAASVVALTGAGLANLTELLPRWSARRGGSTP